MALGAAVLSTGYRPRISRAFWRSRYTRPSGSIVLFLSPAFTSQISALERAHDWTGDCSPRRIRPAADRSSFATLECSHCLQRNVAGNSLADLLELRRSYRDVADPFQAGRPNFSAHSAPLFAGCGANRTFPERRKASRARFSMDRCDVDYCDSLQCWLRREPSCERLSRSS